MDIIRKYKRKITQAVVAILYNANFAGFKNAKIYTGAVKNVCVPGLNCYSCPGAIASCPLGSFQSYLMQDRGRSIINRVPFYVLGFLILFGVVFGRVVCGFLCPFGLFQELLYKIKTRKIKKNKITEKLTYAKYIILVLFVIIIPIIMNYPSFCKFICPAGTLEAGIIHVSLNKNLAGAVGNIFTLKVSIAVLVVIASIFVFRVFCRFVCPLGAIYSFFNKNSILGLKIDSEKCNHCNICINTCRMDVKRVGDRECIECGECINKCHANAIYRCNKKET